MEEPTTDRIPSNVLTVEKESAMNRFIVSEDVSKAEVLWSSYTTVNHISNRASNNTGALYEVMFHDSEIAKQFSCAKDKNAYMVSFSL